jgi:hypothetical protein
MADVSILRPATDRRFDVESITRSVRDYRFSLFGAVALVLRPLAPEFEAVFDAFARLADMAVDDRDVHLSDPGLACWIDAMTIATRRRLDDPDTPLRLAKTITSLMDRVGDRVARRGIFIIGDTGIPLQRDDLDPVIKAVTPPTFDFDAAINDNGGVDPVDRASLERFGAELAVAFDNIKRCDPVRYRDLRRLIRVVGYLPDGQSRSCSAARYAGVVYLAGQEESIIDLEESIVHEAAHQLLYKIGEMTPLTTAAATGDEFELPWSGSKRDLFGYLHAYFIYLEVVKYYDKRAPSAGARRGHCERMAELIHRGLEFATDDIRKAEGLTPAGRALFEHLAADTAALRRGPTVAVA